MQCLDCYSFSLDYFFKFDYSLQQTISGTKHLNKPTLFQVDIGYEKSV